MFSETTNFDLFESLLKDDNISSSDLAEKIKEDIDPAYKIKKRYLTFVERKAKMDEEKRQKEERIRQSTCMDLPMGFENHFEYDKNFKNLLLRLRDNGNGFNLYGVYEDIDCRNILRQNTNLKMI